MKNSFGNSALLFVSLLLTLLGACSKPDASNQRTSSFDAGWLFVKDNPAGAEQPGFDDAAWRQLDLPHDWSIEDLPNQVPDSVTGPFSKASVGRMGTGFTVGGTAWYRKHFTADKGDAGKTAYLQFDGVYMNADIWVNGKHVGNHPYGYTSFWYDVTPYLNPAGQENVVAVQVKNEGLNARWYSGSGIYRHTWLTLVEPVHIAPWGVCVTTPDITDQQALVQVVTSVTNQGKADASVTVAVSLADPAGTAAGQASKDTLIPAGKTVEIAQTIAVSNPQRWSIETPVLYKADVAVAVNNKESDKSVTAFGIRTIHVDAETGFTLNGKMVDLKGGCFHHDNGPLGAAAIDRAEERKMELFKKAGLNAIRCSHNPPSPYLLDVCDRLGIVVIDEAFDMWEKSKMNMAAELFGGKAAPPEDYSKFFKEAWQQDITSMVMRDRNHPSVIMWSIGNEIFEAADTSGLRIAKQLAGAVRKLDATRAVTEAHVDMGATMGGKSSWDIPARTEHMVLLDAVGYNYAWPVYERDHPNYPERVMFASEYMTPQSLQNWQKVESLPYVIGNFSWTVMDYLGEAGTGVPRLTDANPSGKRGFPGAEIMQFFDQNSWPMVINFQGDIDLIGNPKPAYSYERVVWRDQKMGLFVHRPIPAGKKEINSPWGFPDLLPSWNWEGHEGEKLQVVVYTRSKLVKLELNGKPVGEQAVDDSQSITATFEVPYEPGTLVARCYDNGTETASDTLKTLGKPAAVRLTADRTTIRADRNDLSYVMVEIVDAEGNVLPNADDILVKFSLTGNGEIAGVGNGYHSDLSSFKLPQRKTWQGRCLAIVRPKGDPGTIGLKASADGIGTSGIEIVTR